MSIYYSLLLLYDYVTTEEKRIARGLPLPLIFSKILNIGNCCSIKLTTSVNPRQLCVHGRACRMSGYIPSTIIGALLSRVASLLEYPSVLCTGDSSSNKYIFCPTLLCIWDNSTYKFHYTALVKFESH
jgi:hypothetical protein